MMEDIFNNPGKPFYRFGDIILLNKIKRDKWISFIQKSFETSGKKISDVNAECIAESMNDHSWYVQQLAHYVWQKSGKTVKMNEIYSALTELLYANSPFYLREVESLSKGQINLLKAIANKETQLSSVLVMDRYNLGTSASVVKNKSILMYADLIHEQDKNIEFLDPAFELWFNIYILGRPIDKVIRFKS